MRLQLRKIANYKISTWIVKAANQNVATDILGIFHSNLTKNQF